MSTYKPFDLIKFWYFVVTFSYLSYYAMLIVVLDVSIIFKDNLNSYNKNH
jgi:hypothetical protein